jgi:CheY-like chemotaxis protein
MLTSARTASPERGERRTIFVPIFDREGLKMPEMNKPSIFVVDDEQTIALTLAAILDSSGFSARAFSDPLEALRCAEVQCPDFLLSDVMMPQLNGVDLGVQFKAMYPECRILLFSGVSNAPHFLESARKKGHDFNLLTKPVHPKNLLEALRSLGPEL